MVFYSIYPFQTSFSISPIDFLQQLEFSFSSRNVSPHLMSRALITGLIFPACLTKFSLSCLGLIALLTIFVDNQVVSINSSVGYSLKPSRKPTEIEWNYSVLNCVVLLAFDFTKSIIFSKFIYDFLAKFLCKALCKILLSSNSSTTKKVQSGGEKQKRFRKLKYLFFAFLKLLNSIDS